MPFVRPRCNRCIDVPPPAVKGIDKVQHITALGVTLSHNFCLTKHIDTVMAGCAHTFYGLRTLRAHGMPQACLQLVFRSTALATLLYASPTWWLFTNASEKNRGFHEMSWQIRLLYRWFFAHCCCTLWTVRWKLFSSIVHHIAHIRNCITTNFPLK